MSVDVDTSDINDVNWNNALKLLEELSLSEGDLSQKSENKKSLIDISTNIHVFKEFKNKSNVFKVSNRTKKDLRLSSNDEDCLQYLQTTHHSNEILQVIVNSLNRYLSLDNGNVYESFLNKLELKKFKFRDCLTASALKTPSNLLSAFPKGFHSIEGDIHIDGKIYDQLIQTVIETQEVVYNNHRISVPDSILSNITLNIDNKNVNFGINGRADLLYNNYSIELKTIHTFDQSCYLTDMLNQIAIYQLINENTPSREQSNESLTSIQSSSNSNIFKFSNSKNYSTSSSSSVRSISTTQTFKGKSQSASHAYLLLMARDTHEFLFFEVNSRQNINRFRNYLNEYMTICPQLYIKFFIDIEKYRVFKERLLITGHDSNQQTRVATNSNSSASVCTSVNNISSSSSSSSSTTSEFSTEAKKLNVASYNKEKTELLILQQQIIISNYSLLVTRNEYLFNEIKNALQPKGLKNHRDYKTADNYISEVKSNIKSIRLCTSLEQLTYNIGVVGFLLTADEHQEKLNKCLCKIDCPFKYLYHNKSCRNELNGVCLYNHRRIVPVREIK